jgi:hypothetical protein
MLKELLLQLAGLRFRQINLSTFYYYTYYQLLLLNIFHSEKIPNFNPFSIPRLEEVIDE